MTLLTRLLVDTDDVFIDADFIAVNADVITIIADIVRTVGHLDDTRLDVFPERREVLNDGGAKQNVADELSRCAPLELDRLQREGLARVRDDVLRRGVAVQVLRRRVAVWNPPRADSWK